jgi:hypothetical protein
MAGKSFQSQHGMLLTSFFAFVEEVFRPY